MFVRSYLSALVAAGLYWANASPLVVRDDQAVCARNYTVVSGDTCDGIAAAQNVSTFQLELDNPDVAASNCVNLQIGQVLCLGFEGQDCSTIHVVIENDSCTAITANANITLATLLANNHNIDADCTNIFPGEVLCTASEPIGYP